MEYNDNDNSDSVYNCDCVCDNHHISYHNADDYDISVVVVVVVIAALCNLIVPYGICVMA